MADGTIPPGHGQAVPKATIRGGPYHMFMTGGDDPFEGVVGHTHALDLLRTQLGSGRLSHAYLFHGEPGLGKTMVGRRLAAALLPETRLDRHPDYWEDDRIRALSIDEVRLLPDRQPEFHETSLQSFLSRRPAIGQRRVALVSNVGRLKDEVQGILLKTLEEPHPQRVVILTSPSLNPFVVLPTVVSRCQRVAFHPVGVAEIEAMLRAGPAADAELDEIARLARGRPGWALQVRGQPEIVEAHREWVRKLDELAGAPADVALRLATEVDQANFSWRSSERTEEDPVLQALDSWQLRLRERMTTEPRPEPWARLLEMSYDTLGQHEQNVSPRLALECFLLQCTKVA